MVAALEDCTISVTTAPQNAPDRGIAAAFLKDRPQPRSGEPLEAAGHHAHAKQE